MAKPRTCPHCFIRIPIDSGFSFDVALNLLCDNCKKVVIPVSESGFVEITPPYRNYPAHGAWNEQPGHYNNFQQEQVGFHRQPPPIPSPARDFSSAFPNRICPDA